MFVQSVYSHIQKNTQAPKTLELEMQIHEFEMNTIFTRY